MASKITLGKFTHPILTQNAEITASDLQNTLIFGNPQTKIQDLIKNLTVELIQLNTGTVIFDLNNDFEDDFLSSLPEELQSKIQIFDPLHSESIPGVNLMSVGKDIQPNSNQITLIISKIWQIVDRIYDLKTSGGPIFETYFKNTLKLAMVHIESGSTLQVFNQILRDSDFRSFKLCMCDDQNVLNFWNDQDLKPENEAFLTNTIPYITSKLSPFLDNSIVSNIVSQQLSTFNFKEIIQENKILIIRLDQAKIGLEAQKVLGMLLLAKFELDLIDHNFDSNLNKFTLIIPSLEQFISDGLIDLVANKSENIRFIFGSKSPESLNINSKDYCRLLHDQFPNLIQFRSTSNPQTKDLSDNQALFSLHLDQKLAPSIVLEISSFNLKKHQKPTEMIDFYLKGGLTEIEIKKLVAHQEAILYN